VAEAVDSAPFFSLSPPLLVALPSSEPAALPPSELALVAAVLAGRDSLLLVAAAASVPASGVNLAVALAAAVVE